MITSNPTELKERLQPGRRLLGLDVGTKTIGLALSDPGWTIASPLQTLSRRKFTQDAADLALIIAQHKVCGLVIGFPISLEGSMSPRSQSVLQFARNLEAKLPELPMALWDERLSTLAVTRTLLEADASRKRRSELVDKMAAAYILQGALDRMKLV